ncbi:SMI1/KNR4 family protein [Catenuloplanes japonicus]|uniref:SMI1/KNR4 family protein n=1 Tax=Catenuloplanes japonicus TaxID=33876 RepID=UPI000527C7BB|nr:SMI1/KNR4 family protein [Catenuloplanes japonicus]
MINSGRWHGVRDRVLRLADSPGPDEVFARHAHGFALEAPLTEAEVTEAEEHVGIRLPEAYRTFLSQVGAGGAGPAYGLIALRRTTDGWDWPAEDSHRTETTRLGEPFTPRHIEGRPVGHLDLREPVQYDFEYRDDFQVQHNRWQKTLWHPDRTAGAIFLCDQGCLRGYWLVVSGDERGMIWEDNRIDGTDLSPLFDAGGDRLTFSRWYLDWLRRAEDQMGR